MNLKQLYILHLFGAEFHAIAGHGINTEIRTCGSSGWQGRVLISDEQRSGRPVSVRTDLARAVIEQLMDYIKGLYAQVSMDEGKQMSLGMLFGDYGDNSGHMAREASLHPISEKYMWNDCGLYPASM
ncbi:hypothetical protein TNCV_5092091 [Trichonephila clavipes]|nr:hypothetical protein TNCV_5092091 [Trichonephila clavipes]